MKSYAIGVVTKTVKPGDSMIQVYPYSLYPDVDISNLSELKGMECSWHRGESNATIIPQYEKGETVEIVRYADSDYYFVKSIRYEPKLRGKEVQVYTWSALDRTKELDILVNESNSVWVKVDTVNEVLHLHTPSGHPSTEGKKSIDIMVNYKDNIIEVNNSLSKINLDNKVLTFDVETVIFNGKKFNVNHDTITLIASLTEVVKGKLVVGATSTFKKFANFAVGLKANMKAAVVKHSKVV